MAIVPKADQLWQEVSRLIELTQAKPYGKGRRQYFAIAIRTTPYFQAIALTD